MSAPDAVAISAADSFVAIPPVPKLLPVVEGDLSSLVNILEEVSNPSAEIGYDLRPEGMKTITVYMIRTDLQ